MPTICYTPKKFSAARASTIETANEIIKEYRAQGFDLTLRQIYYQFVARDLIDNTQASYNRLGATFNTFAGLIDWNSIEDRTRHVRRNSHWDDPESIISACASSYALDRWATQDTRVEVWIEKDALIGVIQPVCERNDVDYFSCRGYVSQSEMWRAAMRMKGHNRADQSVLLLHLGDHDPSGIDMSRDIGDRLALFGARVEVRRIALTMDQVQEHSPPPNPAKITDSRAADYIDTYGNESWELDALNPTALTSLIEEHILGVRNESKWAGAVDEEDAQKELLQRCSDRWTEVVAMLEEN